MKTLKVILCLILSLVILTGCNKNTPLSATKYTETDTQGTTNTQETTVESNEDIIDTYSVLDKNNNDLLDYIENEDKTTDSDNDGLSDYQEIVFTLTDPTNPDTDKNGINDFSDDCDNDALSNGFELEKDTDPLSTDSDGDGINDYSEFEEYKTDPTKTDSDDDGASDLWEIENGYNPTSTDTEFKITVTSKSNGITAGVITSTNGKTAESITVKPAHNNFLLNETPPGALSDAFEFTATGELGAVEIIFTPSDNLLSNENINPVIYCLNEEEQVFYEMETTVENGTVKTVSSHFSTYIMLDKNVYDQRLMTTSEIDLTKDTGIDSNHDGISDYMTEQLCNGSIRSGTGAKVFGDYTFEEIQANDDIDNDGLKNGDEVITDYSLKIPGDAIEYNGHYYKVYDVGDFALSADSYCKSVGGYLCTITSAEEQNFISNLISQHPKNVYWLGGSRIDEEWKWVTEEEFSYSNWGQDEPNNMEGSENYLQIYAKNFRQKVVGDWNDASNVGAEYASDFYSVANTGYICEWGVYEVNTHNYAYLFSSPISEDTDRDGFRDNIDPTPITADVFQTMDDYKKYYFDNKTTVTICVQQPVWDSRRCYQFGEPKDSEYLQYGGNGHTYLGIDYADGTKYYFGYYADGSAIDSAKISIAVLRKDVPGFVQGELLDLDTESRNQEKTGEPVFTLAKTFVIDDSQLNNILTYKEKHENDIYNITDNNCTTFAVECLKNSGLNVKIYRHMWTHDDSSLEFYLGNDYDTIRTLPDTTLDIIMQTYYGYCPADTAQDIKENYSDYIVFKPYTLKNGEKTYGYSVNK